MSGLGGRSSVLRSSKAGHRRRWCSTVSSGNWQSGHSELVSTPILLRWAFRGTCWDLSRKMLTCSFLFRALISSLLKGVLIYSKIALPLSELVHSLIHNSFFVLLIICLAVSMEAKVSSWGHFAPRLARASALSLPGMSTWLGIH